MLTKGQRVRVKQHQRTRTIFTNSEVSPGKTTTFPGGWTGSVTGVFEGMGEDIIEVLKDGIPAEGQGYATFSPDELEAI